MQDPRSYFNQNQLFNWDNLVQHCEHHGVYLNTSDRFAGLALLKYKDEVQWGDKPWTSFARFSRGLVVDMKNQTVLAHGFDKFFNLGQEPETNFEILKDKKEFEVSEKLDGSCVLSFFNPNDKQFYLTTTGSFDSEHGQVGTELFRKMVACPKIAALAATGTLIFELIDPRFRIVIDYKKKPGYTEGLYLIGYRTQEGRLLSYKEIQDLAEQLKLPTVKTYQFANLDHLLETAKALPVLEEGFVLRFSGDLLVKVKGDAYLRAHRLISRLSDSSILEAVGEGIVDELISIAPEEYRNDVVEKSASYNQMLVLLQNRCYKYFDNAPKDNRKIFAGWVQSNVEPLLKHYLFNIFDNKPLNKKDLCETLRIQEKVSSKTRI